jgi:primosomal protein N' (replication factor Y) (superfamily II helicase)
VSRTPRQSTLFDADPEPTPWEAAAEADRTIVEVVLNRPLDTIYYYVVPEELRGLVQPGQRVRVPFGRSNQLVLGYCVDIGAGGSTSRRLKEVAELIDRRPLLSSEMLELTRWIGQRYLCTWGQVLESVIPAGVKKQAGTRLITMYALSAKAQSGLAELKLPAKQQAVIDVLHEAGGPLSVDQITAAADCGTSPIETLRKKGLLEPVRTRQEQFVGDAGEMAQESDLTLNSDQQRVVDRILASIRRTAQTPQPGSSAGGGTASAHHETFLLHGVTGSGKTEVYIQAIREVVSYGRQAIVLVPEISLTPQTIRRFRSRFAAVAVLHSHLSDAERHWHWQRIAAGEVQVVVGARSAVFAPTPHLGLIVIDEEHETTFKQQSTPRYHAREVARRRCLQEGVPLILGSATPTLESLHRARSGQDVLLSLPVRVNDRPLPPVVIVDVRNDPQIARGHSIGRALQHGIERALKDQGQVILFLNLRGYSPVVWCWKCGGGIKCPECDITLTWHRDRKKVVCHSCEYEADPPQQCPQCDQPGLRYFGTGTQRLEQEVAIKFPGRQVLRMDSDSMSRRGAHDEALEAFRHGEVDILLGTQMIAKGLDFPNVMLVGVINADTLLHQPDLRASERTFQLIAQVAGRTGRGDKGGRVLVQSSCPDEPAIGFAAGHDYEGFARYELAQRQELSYPPYAHLARVILRGEKYDDVHESAREMVRKARTAATDISQSLRILGPAPAPVTRLRGQFRFHFQISAEEVAPISQLWHTALAGFETHAGVEFTIDIDPLDMR